MYFHQTLVGDGAGRAILAAPDWDVMNLPLWVPVAASVLVTVGGALWSVVRRWDLGLRVETRDGRLRASLSVARRPGKH